MQGFLARPRSKDFRNEAIHKVVALHKEKSDHALETPLPNRGYAATAGLPGANASAADVVRFTVDYEGHAADADALLRGASRSPTKMETILFTHDFLASWYALKAKEAANPDAVSAPNSTPGIDNITNGETDYLTSADSDDGGAHPVKFKDVSDKLNGVMVAMNYNANGSYSCLFFLKPENGRLKIDDILLSPFSGGNFNPWTLHRPGVSPGVRQDVAKALSDGKSNGK